MKPKGVSIFVSCILLVACSTPTASIPTMTIPPTAATATATATAVRSNTATPTVTIALPDKPTTTPHPIPFDSLQRLTAANAADIKKLGQIGDPDFVGVLLKSDTGLLAVKGHPTLGLVGPSLYTVEFNPVRVRYVADLHPFEGQIFYNHIVITPDGSQLVTARWDGAIEFWDTASGIRTSLLKSGVAGNHISGMQLVGDGTQLIVADNDGVALWDLATRQIIRQLTTWAATAIAMSPDNRLVATGNLSGSIDIWNFDTGEKNGVLVSPSRSPNPWRLAFSPDGKLLVAGWRGGDAVVFNVEANAAVQSIPCQGIVTGIDFSPDSKWLLVTAESTYIWKTTGSYEPIRLVLHGDPYFGDSPQAVFVEGGSKILSISDDYSIIWEVERAAALDVEDRNVFHISAMKFMPDGNLAVITPSRLQLYDLRKQVAIRTMDYFSSSGPAFVAIARDVPLAALLSGTTLGVVDFYARQVIMTVPDDTIPLGQNIRYGVAISPDGNYVATFIPGNGGTRPVPGLSPRPCTVNIWMVKSGKQILNAVKPGWLCNDVEFDSSGTRLAVAGGESGRNVELWDLKGNVVAAFGKTPESVAGLAFSSNGASLIFWDWKNNYFVRDNYTGSVKAIGKASCPELMLMAGGAPSNVSAMQALTQIIGCPSAINHDGSLLAVHNFNGVIELWGVRSK